MGVQVWVFGGFRVWGFGSSGFGFGGLGFRVRRHVSSSLHASPILRSPSHDDETGSVDRALSVGVVGTLPASFFFGFRVERAGRMLI